MRFMPDGRSRFGICEYVAHRRRFLLVSLAISFVCLSNSFPFFFFFFNYTSPCHYLFPFFFSPATKFVSVVGYTLPAARNSPKKKKKKRKCEVCPLSLSLSPHLHK
ncbi:hypothetical protein F4775DRAFT_563090 [Biscogniauxia sp. FL1348]|nr:hypothetical protein F4775DRAFT_563090 [Biscogniauxia sp. FL1348]